MKLRYKILPFTLCVAMSMTGCGLSSANQNYSKALSAYEKNDFSKAEEYFLKAIDDNTDKAEYHIDYGFSLLQLKEYDKAREQFNYVILDKDIPMVKENNKKAYRGLGISYLFEGNYESAINNFDLALEIDEMDSLNVDLMYYKASAIEKSGDYEKAIDIYTAIIELEPKEAQVYSSRANQYRLAGNYESSIADYDKAIELDGNEFEYYIGKFATLKENNKNAEATAVLEQAATLKINGDDDKFDLAKVHYYQENYELAMNELTQCIETGYTQAYYYVGEMNLMNENYESAISNFNQYIEAGNGVSGALYNQMLTCYLQLGDYDQAKEYLNKAKKMSDSSISTQLLKNEIIYLEQMGQFSEALTCMEEYIKICPEDNQAQKDYYFLKTRTQALSAQTETVNPQDTSNQEGDDIQQETGTTVDKP